MNLLTSSTLNNDGDNNKNNNSNNNNNKVRTGQQCFPPPLLKIPTLPGIKPETAACKVVTFVSYNAYVLLCGRGHMLDKRITPSLSTILSSLSHARQLECLPAQLWQ